MCLQAPNKAPPSDWPQEGRIEFKKVYMTYSIDEAPVLKDLNFVIFPEEKVTFELRDANIAIFAI